jgi:beta-aspartyl-peptidase (threonine type)
MTLRLLAFSLFFTAVPAFAQVVADPPLDAAAPEVAPESTRLAEPDVTAPETPAQVPLQIDIDPPKRWGLVIHGGAGVLEKDKMTPEKDAAIRAALKAALDAGGKVLASGGSATDAVEAAIVILEDDPHFNAGRGAVLAADGSIALDAAIMDGSDRKAGAVAGVHIARNPIRAAHRVMTDSPHVLLTGMGADDFVKEKGLETADQKGWFETPERRRKWEEWRKEQFSGVDVERKFGTVGAVARDMEGHVAAGTSTGGLTGKKWGRVGDSPLIGAGTYADDRSCAVSATGDGEYFIRVGVAHEICARVRLSGEKIVPAARAVLDETKALGGEGGVIVLTPDGQMGWSFNTPGMYRGGKDSTGRERVAIYGDE